jgi:hypothetical protein
VLRGVLGDKGGEVTGGGRDYAVRSFFTNIVLTIK